MSHVRLIDETEATGDALEILQGYKGRIGYIPDMFRAMANSPTKIGPVASFLKSLQHGSTSLGGRREELISVVISVRNRCRYWATSHGEFLRKYLREWERVVQVARDWRNASFLSDQDKALLAFAEKVSDDANAVTAADVDTLRSAGFTEEQIVDAAFCTAMRVFTNKLNASLGIEPDPIYKPGERLIDLLPEVFGSNPLRVGEK